MRKVTCLLAVALLAIVTLGTAPAVAQPPPVAARISGGGTADFVMHPKALNSTGYTEFSVGLTVYANGTASGQFVCMIPSVVIVSLDVKSGKVNIDGSVTVSGIARGYDSFIPGPYSGLPVTVTFRAGGPGVGGFDYVDASGFFFPDLFDTELVRRGMIRITK